MTDRLARAFAAIDATNADDPVTVEVDGDVVPKEQAHAALMSAWVDRLAPDASEALRLAARAHHVRRWTWPRDRYPPGRAGYLRWRRDLQERHVEIAAGILASIGYDKATIERVGEIMHKRGLGTDAEVQTYEDALCLVFLQTQLADLADRTDPARMTDILVRTLRKMSGAARRHAVEIPFRPGEAALVEDALSRLETG